MVVNTVAIVPTQIKILTMTIRKQLQNVVFLLKNRQKYFITQLFLVSHCYRSVTFEPIYLSPEGLKLGDSFAQTKNGQKWRKGRGNRWGQRDHYSH